MLTACHSVQYPSFSICYLKRTRILDGRLAILTTWCQQQCAFGISGVVLQKSQSSLLQLLLLSAERKTNLCVYGDELLMSGVFLYSSHCSPSSDFHGTL